MKYIKTAVWTWAIGSIFYELHKHHERQNKMVEELAKQREMIMIIAINIHDPSKVQRELSHMYINAKVDAEFKDIIKEGWDG